MIAQMDQLTVVGRRGIAKELLTSLQSLGVVQIDPLEPGEALEGLEPVRLEGEDKTTKEQWDAVASRSAALIDAANVGDIKPAARSEVPSSLEELERYIETTGRQIDQVVAERAEIRDELELMDTYLPLFRNLAPTLAQVENSRYLHAVAFSVPEDSLDEVKADISETLEERVIFSSRPYGKEMLAIAVSLKRDQAELKAALGRAGVGELGLPERYTDMGMAKAVHTMEERSQSLPKRLDALERELTKLGEQHGAKLNAVNQVARNHQSRLERLEDLAEGRYGFALRGWMPSGEKNKVVEGLKKQFGDDIAVETRQADEHYDHNVPVKLDNPDWVKPFEGLLSLFAPPKYGNFDPSWTLAVFFPFFFGLVVGDMGFALMFAGIAYWMRQRGAKGKDLDLGPLGITIRAAALKPITTVIFWCAAWSFVFGFVYGEFFGNFLEHWPENRPIFYVPGHGEEVAHGAEAVIGDHSEAATDDHSESAAEGHSEAAVTETHAEDTEDHSATAAGEDHGEEEGHAKGLIPIILFRVEQFQPLLLASIGFGILQVLGGWGIRIYYGIKHHDMKHVWEGIGMIGGLVGLIVFSTAYLTTGVTPLALTILIIGLAIFLLGMIMSRVFLMLIELASNAGNILSYLRLFAVGLSAALVANLATNLGFAISHAVPIIGPILGILVGFSVHIIAIALTIIGHTLQPLRLNYVEFFTKFGFYEESGRPYTPFRLLGGKS